MSTRSRSEEWATPQALFDLLDAEFHFTLDPCATAANAKCDRYYTKGKDGLAYSWAGEVVFMNPPYCGQTERWMAKAVSQWEKGATVVALVRAQTDSAWWHIYAMRATEIRFIERKIAFVNEASQASRAPFPSVLLVYLQPPWGRSKYDPICKSQGQPQEAQAK